MNDWKIIKLEDCDSTNSYAKELRKQGLLEGRTAIMSGWQTKGRGQATNSWFSEKNQNLLCSICLKVSIPASEHFILNVFTSLTLIELLGKYDIKGSIKWPNDIYVDNQKIAGILIENSLMGAQITETIIGIGLNVNQQNFPDTIPNPVSMHQLKSRTFDLQEILTALLHILEKAFAQEEQPMRQQAFNSYLLNLYKLNTWSLYRTNDQNFEGRIIGVKPDGRLIIETDGGKLKLFEFGEISFLI